MSITTCTVCGHSTTWYWEEAFDKFGYGDGDGNVMTEHVANALRQRGYVVDVERWGLHNDVIMSIRCGDKDLIPSTCEIGYDNPRDYLPEHIVTLLDATFSESTEVAP